MKGRLRIPGEWERHEACWLAFPYIAEEWALGLDAAQRSIAALCRAIAGPGGEAVRLLVRDERVEERARSLVGDANDVHYVTAPYGDCWLRDTAPVLGHDESGKLGGLLFQFNGWGGKYPIPYDDVVGDWLLERLSAHGYRSAIVLEGGALESNGHGTFLCTDSCALNPNRNPGLTRDAFERALEELVAVDRMVWLERGLQHDHTDGHIDMLARFASEDAVLCMRPRSDAPNADVLDEIARALRDAELDVIELPAPPALTDDRGAPLPGSYCNFYIANEAVIVPTYGVPEDDVAVRIIGSAFEGREAIGLPSRDLLCGGGALHCVTQPQPSPP